MLKPFQHQTTTTDFILNNKHCLITSDPGTGKTRSVIDAYAQRRAGRMLVLAPLSILEASWGDDLSKFQSDVSYVAAHAKNRAAAFNSDAAIVLTNHDAVKWIAKNPQVLEGFDTLCIDEFTAFKNKDSQRSKAAAKIAEKFEYRIAMSGTPNSNTILDIWHPTLLVDGGERLGRRFYGFRNAVCTTRFNGFANEWIDKPDAEQTVAAALHDINIRYTLENCIDMPEQTVSTRYVTLSPTIYKQYLTLANESVLSTNSSVISAVHAGAKIKKLLQLCTGCVYDGDGVQVGVHEERYQLVLDLIKERSQSLVAFNWQHERDHLTAECAKQNIKYGVIDGSTPPEKRKDVVDRLQAGHLQVVFAHPQSAGHGLTMTKATTVIWSSPSYNAEHYQQFNRRIYRAGQTKRTEVIHIAARDTWEENVYEKLQSKLSRMEDLLTILNTLHQQRKTA